MELQATLITDFYKQLHAEQYDKRLVQLVSYYIPRKSKIPGINKIPVIGIQYFIKKYLIDYFNETFFKRSLEDILFEYKYVIKETMGENRINSNKIELLHKLGYLPIRIRALSEGLFCPIGCPILEISCTHPEFIWCVNLIETLLSSELWFSMCTAISGITYRNIVNKYFIQSSDNHHLRKSAISEFGFRGLVGVEGAIKTSLGFLMSFDKTTTIPSIVEISKYYRDKPKDIGSGTASTEHSVMCSSYSIDGDEKTLIKKLLTEIYPDGNISIVLDSYDYWNVIKNILPNLKDEILSRNGTLFCRGDSGNPVEIITKTVDILWSIFGGTINSKGYKVLDSHIRVIYGDAITPSRAEQIYSWLVNNNFSAENVSLGAGSFSMSSLMLKEDEIYFYNRDTFSVAIKSTYGVYFDRNKYNSIFIKKDPKTDDDKIKKSLEGCIKVMMENDQIKWIDKLKYSETFNSSNLLQLVFENGILTTETSFTEIRNRLWNNDF